MGSINFFPGVNPVLGEWLSAAFMTGTAIAVLILVGLLSFFVLAVIRGLWYDFINFKNRRK